MATEQTHRCALFFVEKNLRMRTTFSGDARSGRRSAVKDIPNMDDRLFWPPCTSRCEIFLEDSEVVARAHDVVSEQPLHTSCNTLPENVLAETRIACETHHVDSIVAWTDGAVFAVKMRGSDRLVVESSSALVTPVIDPSLFLRNFQRQSSRCVFIQKT